MKRKNSKFSLATLIFTASMLTLTMIASTTAKAAQISSNDFLKADGKVLRNNSGNVVQLRGTNAGGYLLQELWMTPTTETDNVHSEMDIYNTLKSRFGEATMRDLVGVYEDNYWTTKDFDNCQALGINCIRLPFWYMNFVDFNGNLLPNAFNRVDWFVQEAGKRGIYVILDMHGAPGSQNGVQHSGIAVGSDHQTQIAASQLFFGSNALSNQQKYNDLWKKIADHFKDNPTVAGYDLLNEPYCEYRYDSGKSDDTLHSTLWNVYNNAYKTIRSVDTNHIIIMEATWDPVDLPNPSTYSWTNVMYEYHNYKYGADNDIAAQVSNMQDKVNKIINQGYNVPSYMGEFAFFNNISAWQQGTKVINDAGLNWTTWSYKKTGSGNDNWGLYNQNIQKPNLATDSADTIRSKWSNVGTSIPNTQLINALKPYFTAGQPNGPTNPTSPISDGEYYLTAIANNKVVCADNTGTSPLIANRDTFGGAWESLSIVNNSDGTISLKSNANGKYVCAVIDSKNELVARSATIGTWEKFTLQKITDTQYALKAVANNNFVKADLNNNGVLYASSSAVGGAWEAFTITPVK